MKNELKWKPVISFLCILASLFFISALFSLKIGSIIVGSFSGFLATLAGIFPEHWKIALDFWLNKIKPATHNIFIEICIAIGLTSIIFFFTNNKLSLKIENR